MSASHVCAVYFRLYSVIIEWSFWSLERQRGKFRNVLSKVIRAMEVGAYVTKLWRPLTWYVNRTQWSSMLWIFASNERLFKIKYFSCQILWFTKAHSRKHGRTIIQYLFAYIMKYILYYLYFSTISYHINPTCLYCWSQVKGSYGHSAITLKHWHFRNMLAWYPLWIK